MEGSLQNDDPKPAGSRWRIETREVIASNRWHEYRHDSGVTDYGKPYDYFYIYKKYGSVAVIPLTSDGKIVFVRQYRYLMNSDSLEIPGGGQEEVATSEEVARRELREESGYEAASLKQIGVIDIACGHSTDRAPVFIAQGCTQIHSQDLEDTEQGITVELYTVQEAYAMADTGKITDSFTLSALCLARRHLLG